MYSFKNVHCHFITALHERGSLVLFRISRYFLVSLASAWAAGGSLLVSPGVGALCREGEGLWLLGRAAGLVGW